MGNANWYYASALLASGRGSSIEQPIGHASPMMTCLPCLEYVSTLDPARYQANVEALV